MFFWVGFGASAGQIAWTAALLCLVLIPTAKILHRAGYSPWYALSGLMPILGLVALLAFAFCPTPLQEKLQRQKEAN